MSRIAQRRITLDDELWNALSELARTQELNVAAVIRRACVEYLSKHGVTVTPTIVDGRGRRGLGRRPKPERAP